MATPDESQPAWLPRTDRLIFAATVLLAVAAIGFTIGLFVLGSAHESVMAQYERVRMARLSAFSLLQATIDAETGQRGFLLTGDDELLEPFNRGASAASAHLARLRALTASDPSLVPIVDRAEQHAETAIAMMRQTIATRSGRSLNFSNLPALYETRAVMDALRTEVATLLRAFETQLDTARDQDRAARLGLYVVSAFLALISIAAVALMIFATRIERRSWRDALQLMVRANMESEQAREKAAASDLAKTRFLAAASHDMRQPLHALTLYLSALQRRVEGEEARGILEKMDRATHSMVGMFNTLLDLARIQADVVKPEIDVFPLQDVIDRLIGEHPDADLTGPSPPTTIEVRSDPVLLERLLRNLITNALKHGGGAARIAVAQKDQCAEIAVIDHGPGIAEEDQARIFDEFTRLDERAGADGLGLGLAIVKRIADLLGATIELKSKRGEGATFIVRVPIAAAKQISEPPSAANSAGSIAGLPILVMDDDALALEAAAGVLRDLGADVRTAQNEADAARILSDGFAPYLMLMDLRIDGALTGIEIAERLSSRVEPRPYTIIVTGDTAADTLAELRRSGHAWLIKPVARDDLVRAVAAVKRAPAS